MRTTEPAAIDWATVQFEYEQHQGTIPEICTRHGVSEAQLRQKRQRQGWKLRHDWQLRVGPLLNRMMRVLDGQVRVLERDMNQPVDKTASLLGAMTKTLEKLIEMDEHQRRKQPETRKEVSELRNKLAARIEQLKRGA